MNLNSPKYHIFSSDDTQDSYYQILNPSFQFPTNFLPVVGNTKSPESIQSPSVSVDQNKIQSIVSRDNLADITLPGYAVKLIRKNGPMSFADLAQEVSKCYQALRRSDGSKYEGDYKKALKGSLSSSDVFKEEANNIWTVNEKQAQIFEVKTTEKIKSILQKQAQKAAKKQKSTKEALPANPTNERKKSQEGGRSPAQSSSPKGSVKSHQGQSLNVKRPADDFEKGYEVLAMSYKAFKSNQKVQYMIANPLEALVGDEKPQEMLQKLGKERFLGMMQCYEYFLPILESHMKLQSLSRGVSQYEE